MPHTRLLLLATLLVACSANPTPTPLPERGATPRPVAEGPARVLLANGYSGVARVQRSDSIVLSLPDGGRQLQRLSRRAQFTVTVDARNQLRIRLDSIELRPSAGGREREAVGTVWTGRLGPGGVEGLRANRRGELVAELGALAADLFPALPQSGVTSGDRWVDTSKTKRQVEIFEANDERTRTWSVGRRSTRDGVLVLPVTSSEQYVQLGEGEQAGREMRMSADGRRSTTYYLTMGGRIDGIVSSDSANRLITIPDTRQAVPTTQVVRIRVEFRY